MKELTKRELEICKYLTKGLKNEEIADILYLSKHTIKAYVKTLSIKLNAKNRTEIAYILGKENII